ncbi:MAG TPA: hypothetical protein PKH07_14820 [bacterium]|nr:hypothetical protein [bacterium]
MQEYQRIACFRLAVHLKKLGMPPDIAIVCLQAWAAKNKPHEPKGIITHEEILSQVQAAFEKPYLGCGCNEPTVRQFCDPNCPLQMRRTIESTDSSCQRKEQ